MSDETQQAMPKPTGGLNAYLQVDGAIKAAEFYRKAFAAEQVYAVPADEEGRTMHIHLHVNGSSLMLGDAYPEHGHPVETPGGFTLTLNLAADNIDSWWQRAVDAGCEVTVPLQVMFWGDRWGQLRDPFGVVWAMNAPAS